MKHISEEDLVLLYYDEAGVTEDARGHLASCPECRAAAESLSRTLRACDEWTVPDTGEDFGRSTWARLAPRMEEKRRWWWTPRFRLAFAAVAVAAVLIAAFTAGRLSRHAEPSITAGLSKQARARILAISLADHLDRAELLLTEISNASDSDPSEFSDMRGRAQDLVDEGRLMRQALAAQGDSATLSLLDEVERFMIEVSNAPDQLTAEDVRGLQQRIGSGSLLFKVRIIESNLRTEGQKS